MINLTDDQKKVKHAVRGFFGNNEKLMFINGSAGTGKTYILKHVHEETAKYNEFHKLINPNHEDKTMQFTATTNKAVNVLQQQMGKTAYVTTIHSLFGLRPHGKGIVGGLQDHKIKETLNNVILVIDEASMITDQLFKYLEKYIVNSNLKIICMGDINQLPPVKQKTLTAAYTTADVHVELTQVIRQKNDLLNIVDEFREFVIKGTFPGIDLTLPCVQHLNRKDFETEILADMSRPDWDILQSRVLAYNNKMVNHYNDLIKEHITGTSALKIGEQVINNSYVRGHNKIGVATEAVVFIKDIFDFNLLMDDITIPGKSFVIDVNYKDTQVWMPNDFKDYKTIENYYSSKNELIPAHIDNILADLRPIYASTIHKSQGSTFDRVYIDLDTIKKVQYYDSLMFPRLLYVAVSRAAKEIIFTGDI